MTEFLQQLLNGLSLGAIYALIALGYTMVYGVLRFINFAHSDVFMVGAFIGFYSGHIVPEGTIWGGLVVLLVSMLGCALLGMRIERSAYRPLREPTDFNLVTILAALGGAIAAFYLARTFEPGGYFARLLDHKLPADDPWRARLARWLVPGEFNIVIRLLACWAGAEICAWLAARTKWRFVLWRTAGGAPTLNVLITAIGISLLLEYSGQVFFGAAPRTFPTVFPVVTVGMPTLIGILSASAAALFWALRGSYLMAVFGSLGMGWGAYFGARLTRGFFRQAEVVISSNQLIVIVVAVVLMLALQFIVYRTKIGTAMRAVSLNPKAAQLVGVNNDVVISFTFGLGSALAAAGGILYALNYPSIDPLMGVMPGLKAFVAAILGGIGNIPGAALGGLILGTVETFVNGSEWSTYKDAIAFAILIIILLFRPAGLLGKFTVEKV